MKIRVSVRRVASRHVDHNEQSQARLAGAGGGEIIKSTRRRTRSLSRQRCPAVVAVEATRREEESFPLYQQQQPPTLSPRSRRGQPFPSSPRRSRFPPNRSPSASAAATTGKSPLHRAMKKLSVHLNKSLKDSLLVGQEDGQEIDLAPTGTSDTESVTTLVSEAAVRDLLVQAVSSSTAKHHKLLSEPSEERQTATKSDSIHHQAASEQVRASRSTSNHLSRPPALRKTDQHQVRGRTPAMASALRRIPSFRRQASKKRLQQQQAPTPQVAKQNSLAAPGSLQRAAAPQKRSVGRRSTMSCSKEVCDLRLAAANSSTRVAPRKEEEAAAPSQEEAPLTPRTRKVCRRMTMACSREVVDPPKPPPPREDFKSTEEALWCYDKIIAEFDERDRLQQRSGNHVASRMA